MASTGNTFPGTGENVDRGGLTDWVSPGNITADDTTDATVVGGASGSDYLVARNFGFTIPGGATIQGVTVRAEGSEHTGGTEPVYAQLQNETATLVGSSKNLTFSGTAKVVYTYGGTADTWGASLTPAICNDVDFGVRLWFLTAHDVRIDFVTLAVEYIVAHSLTGDAGSYTVTGRVALFPISGGPGSYSVSGAAATIERAVPINMGAYSLVGASVTLRIVMPAEAGTYALTGTDATLTPSGGGDFTMPADAGAYSVEGQAVVLAIRLAAGAGSYTLTGTTTTLRLSMAAEAGSYAVAGTGATLRVIMAAPAGSYALTGTDATLTWLQPGVYSMPADAGVYSLTGSLATLRIRLSATAGSYGVTGADASLLRSFFIVGSPGTYTLAGQVMTPLARRRLVMAAGTYALIGIDAGLGGMNPRLTAEAGAYGLTGALVVFPARFYFRENAATINAVDPSGTDWEHLGSVLSYDLSPVPDAGTPTNYLRQPDIGEHLPDADTFHWQYVTAPLAAQTLSGLVKVQFQGYETNAANELRLTVKVLVCSTDGQTIVATPLPITRDNLEVAASLMNRQFSATLATTEIVSGQRLVVEMGMGGQPLASGQHNGYLRFGNAATDLPENDTETGTTFRPWIQFQNGAKLQIGRLLEAGAGAYSLIGVAVALSGPGRRVISAEPGQYALTAAITRLQRQIPLGTGSYGVTGSAATLTLNASAPPLTLTANAGGYNLNGTPVVFDLTQYIEPASYGVTGYQVGLLHQILSSHSVFAASGPIAVTGTAATLRRGRRMALDAGAYAVVGTDANLTKNKVWTLTAEAGVYSVAGSVVGAVHGYRLTAEAGAYSIAGVSAAIPLGAIRGTYAVSGAAATLRRLPYRLTADAGAYSLTGAGVSLPGLWRLMAAPGTYAVATPDAGLIRQIPGTRSIFAESGSYQLVGTNAALQFHWIAEAGAYAVTGEDELLQLIRRVSPDAGSYAITGTSATLLMGRRLVAAPGAYALTGGGIASPIPSADLILFVYESLSVPEFTHQGLSVAEFTAETLQGEGG